MAPPAKVKKAKTLSAWYTEDNTVKAPPAPAVPEAPAKGKRASAAGERGRSPPTAKVQAPQVRRAPAPASPLAETPVRKSSVWWRTKPGSAKAQAGQVRKSVTGELVVVCPNKGDLSPSSTLTPASPAQTWRSAQSLETDVDSPSSRASRRFGRLGAHYDTMPSDLSPRMFDASREEHDAMLADTLHNRRPSEMPHPMLGSPRSPMRAAFTDRAARLREGRGTRRALMSDDHEETEWFKHGDCDCVVCEPSKAPQAGAPSHQVWYNTTPPCAKDSHPSPPRWQTGPSKTFTSHGLTRSMSHPLLHSAPPADTEVEFAQKMGRKMKARDLSPWSWTQVDGEPAGRFNVDFRPEIMACTSKGRQAFQGSADGQPPRSGVGMSLSPREGDPPPATKITITARGKGACRDGFSPSAERMHMRSNQQVFRYDGTNTLPRGRVPSPNYGDETGAGLTSRGFADRHERERPDSPKRSPRALIGTQSQFMSNVLNYDVGEQAALKETRSRHRSDPPFVSLCGQTAEHLKTQRLLGKEVKQMCGESRVGQHLAWE